MPQSILNRGADTILDIGAWNNSPAAPDLNLPLTDNEVVTEGFVTTLTLGDRNSLLSRGASGRLYIGAFIHPDAIADLNQALVDNEIVTESIILTNTPTIYPFNSLLNRGAGDNYNGERKLEIGAWQTPYPRVAGKMPDVPAAPVLFVSQLTDRPPSLMITPSLLEAGRGLSLYEMFIDDLTEIIAYKMQIIANSASDDYSDEFIKFDFYTKHILITTWDNPVDVILTRHGQENWYINVNGFGFLKKLAVRGYKIKNTNPGMVARYQMVVFG